MDNFDATILTDEDLVHNYKQGSNASMELIMERYKPIIKSIARKYFLQGGETDDLLQEGMIGLYKSVVSYDSKLNSDFKAYAIMCIKRQMFSAIKVAGAKKHVLLNSAQSFEVTNADEIVGQVVEEEFIKQEEQEERLRKVNERITSLEQNILKFYLEGLSYKEIGDKLNITPKSVDNALSAIKKKLKK